MSWNRQVDRLSQSLIVQFPKFELKVVTPTKNSSAWLSGKNRDMEKFQKKNFLFHNSHKHASGTWKLIRISHCPRFSWNFSKSVQYHYQSLGPYQFGDYGSSTRKYYKNLTFQVRLTVPSFLKVSETVATKCFSNKAKI